MVKLILTAVLIISICFACSETAPTDPSAGQPGPEKIVITTLTNINTGKNNPVSLTATAYYTNEEFGTSTSIPSSNFSWSTASDMVFTSGTNNSSVSLTSSGAAGVFSRTVTIAAWRNGARTEKTVTINHAVDWAIMPQQPGMNAETLRIAPNGDIYIASDYNNSNQLVIKKFNGSSWETLPALSGYSDLSDTMDLDQNGIPHFVHGGSVYRYSAGSWSQLGGQSFHGSGVSFPQICVATAGDVYVSFADTTNNYKAKVIHFNGSTWSGVGASGISGGIITYNCMRVYNGIPHITFNDTLPDGNFITVKAFYSGAWYTVGQQKISLGSGMNPQLYLSPDNKLYVFFLDGGDNYRTTIRRLDGNTWVAVGNAIGTGILSGYGSLHISSSGEKYFVYYKNGTYAYKLNGNTWEQIGSFVAGETTLAPKIFTRADGLPYVIAGKFMRFW